MEDMNEEERKMIREIYLALVGDLKEEGFIGKTEGRLEKLEGELGRYKKYIALVLIPIGGIIADRIAGLIM
jgi:hypothetical protein